MDQVIVGVGAPLKDRIRALVERLRQGGKEPGEEFRDVLEDTDPFELERAEEELKAEGIGPEDILLLCDARFNAF